MPALWWVELDLLPLVVMSSGVFTGGCELSTTVGNPSADGWGSVPPCWWFGLRHPNTGACTLLAAARFCCQNGGLMQISIPWGPCHQCPCPHSEPQLIPTSPGHSLKPAGRFNLGSYGVTGLCWFPVHMKPWVHLSRVNSVSPSPALTPHRSSRPHALGDPHNARSSGWGA